MSLIERLEKPRPPRPARSGPRPKLAMTQLPIFRVKSADLEDYLHEVFRTRDFKFLFAAGVAQGECPEYVVQPALPASHAYVHQANDIRAGRRSRNVALILNVLCLDGFIPAGKYIIDTHPQPRAIDVYTSMVKARLAAHDLDCLRNPACLAFKEGRREDRRFMTQAAEVDKVAEEVIAREREVLGERNCPL